MNVTVKLENLSHVATVACSHVRIGLSTINLLPGHFACLFALMTVNVESYQVPALFLLRCARLIWVCVVCREVCLTADVQISARIQSLLPSTADTYNAHLPCGWVEEKALKISHPNKNLSWPAGWSCRKCTEINSWTYLNEMFKPNKYGFSKAFLLTLYFLLLRSPLKWQCISLSQRVLQPKAGYQMGLGDRRWENSNPATSHPKVLNLSASPRPSPVGKDMGKCWRRRRKTI